MHQRARWDNADFGSYLITYVKHDWASLVPGWELSPLGFVLMSFFILTHAFGFNSPCSTWNAPIILCFKCLSSWSHLLGSRSEMKHRGYFLMSFLTRRWPMFLSMCTTYCTYHKKKEAKYQKQDFSTHFFHCQSRKRTGRAVFEMTQSRRLNMLPIIDFMPMDYGQPHQAFGFEVGPVCFK